MQLSLLVLLAAFPLSMTLAPLAAAQQSLQLEEIVVTAQKREQSLQDVPISATVLTSDAMEEYRIRNIEDVVLVTPNVSMQSSGFAGELNLTIRGMQNLGGQVNSYGVYQDEFNVAPAGLTITVNPSFLDVERVEVLRGPQGVAFGRNVIGGAISIVTKKPGETFEAELGGGWSRYSTWYAKAATGGPVTEDIGVRVSGYGARSDGFITDIGTSGATNDYDRFGGRVALRFTPGDALTVDLALDHTTADFGLQSNVPAAVVGLDAPALASTFGVTTPLLEGQGTWPENTDTVSTDFPARQELERDLVQLNASLALGDHTLRLVSGYLEATRFYSEDADFTGGSYTAHIADDRLRSGSIELRLAGPLTDNLDYLTGVLYSRDVSDQYFEFQFGPDGFAGVNFLIENVINPGLVAAGEPPLPLFDEVYQMVNFSPERLETESLAAFGDLSWQMNDRTQLLAGVRVTSDDTRSDFTRGGTFLPSAFFQGQLIPFVTSGTGAARHTAVTPRVALNFQATEDVSLYVSAARGYKSGGFNAAALATAKLEDIDLAGVDLAYDPEYAWAYESGIKTRLFDGRLRLDAAAFYTEWSDLQVDVFNLQAFSVLTLNAAEATSRGVEIDWSARLGSHWDLRGGLGYLDAEFDDFPQAQFGGLAFDASGNQLPTAPDLTGSIGLRYSTPLPGFAVADGGDLLFFAQGEYAYQSARFADITNDPLREFDAFGVADFSLGVTNEQFRAAFFVENALDEEYVTSYSGDVPFSGLRVDVHPRTWGAEFRYSF